MYATSLHQLSQQNYLTNRFSEIFQHPDRHRMLQSKNLRNKQENTDTFCFSQSFISSFNLTHPRQKFPLIQNFRDFFYYSTNFTWKIFNTWRLVYLHDLEYKIYTGWICVILSGHRVHLLRATFIFRKVRRKFSHSSNTQTRLPTYNLCILRKYCLSISTSRNHFTFFSTLDPSDRRNVSCA